MELNIIKAFINGIKNNGEFSTKVVTRTIPSWRATTDNPYVVIRKEGRRVVERVERVTKLTYYNNDIMIGGKYVAQVEKQIEKVGADKKEWQAEPMRGTEWENFPYLMHSTKENEQKYVRFTMRHNAKAPKTLFFLDGELVTDIKTIEDIKSWLKPYTPSTKQAEFGVREEDMVKPLNIKIENIIYLSQSGKEEGNKTFLSYFD